MINNKIIILQKFDPDRNDKLCDIEEDNEIQDKSEVKVFLFEKSSSLVDKPICTSVISDISQNEQIDETYAINVKVIHTEPANLDNIRSFGKSFRIFCSKKAFISIKNKIITLFKVLSIGSYDFLPSFW